MPLLPGSDKKIISNNIEEMEKAGHPHNQAVAAALNKAYHESQKPKTILRKKQK